MDILENDKNQDDLDLSTKELDTIILPESSREEDNIIRQVFHESSKHKFS